MINLSDDSIGLSAFTCQLFGDSAEHTDSPFLGDFYTLQAHPLLVALVRTSRRHRQPGWRRVSSNDESEQKKREPVLLVLCSRSEEYLPKIYCARRFRMRSSPYGTEAALTCFSTTDLMDLTSQIRDPRYRWAGLRLTVIKVINRHICSVQLVVNHGNHSVCGRENIVKVDRYCSTGHDRISSLSDEGVYYCRVANTSRGDHGPAGSSYAVKAIHYIVTTL